MRTALVELNIPPSGDATAAYVALSRVRTRESLFILRDFDSKKLRRSGSKAGVDILLQRLRGELTDEEEGSKRCMGCRRLKKRSGFVSASTKSTRQWESRDRRCLECMYSERQQQYDKMRKRQCRDWARERITLEGPSIACYR